MVRSWKDRGCKSPTGSNPVLSARLCSSVVEHFSHKEVVGGSNPPTAMCR